MGSSGPVGVKSPSGLIWLRRGAVNTHFCCCQSWGDGQSRGTQRHPPAAGTDFSPFLLVFSRTTLSNLPRFDLGGDGLCDLSSFFSLNTLCREEKRLYAIFIVFIVCQQ